MTRLSRATMHMQDMVEANEEQEEQYSISFYDPQTQELTDATVPAQIEVVEQIPIEQKSQAQRPNRF